MRSKLTPPASAALALVVLAGCHHHPSGLYHLEGQPVFEADGQARALALTTAEVQAARPRAAGTWYAGRNDRGPMVVVGYESPAYSQSVVTINDRRSTRRGAVDDRHDQTTRRQTYRESAR